jgi:xylulokinase
MPAAPLLLGLDIGTTSIKAIVFDVTGQPVAQASLRTPTYYPQPGRAYYQPEELWQITVQVVRTVTSRVDDARRIAGLAVASFAETGVALDEHDQPTGEAIAWFDNRTAPQAQWLEQTFGQEPLFAITGIALEPIFGLCKWLWLRQNDPERAQRTRRWLNMADYIAWRLCGVQATDFSLASRTLWLDLQRRQWSAQVLDWTATPHTLLAPLLPSGTQLGSILPDVAAATGLPASAQVAVGGHDHICGALALGVTEPADVLNSIGTAEAIFLPLDQPLTDPMVGQQGYSQGVHVGGQYYVLGGMYTSGACVEWFRENLAGGADYATLIQEAAEVPAGSLGAVFLPHLRMSNPPHMDAQARGSFIGLRTDAKRGALFRAVLEGLAFECRSSLEPLLQHVQLPGVRHYYVTGGGAYNELALAIKASVLNHVLHVVSVKEATALGAALLGGVAAGVYADLPDALRHLCYTQAELTPVAEIASLYEAIFRTVYQPMYNTLQPLHQLIHQLQNQDAQDGRI